MKAMKAKKVVAVLAKSEGGGDVCERRRRLCLRQEAKAEGVSVKGGECGNGGGSVGEK
jgi:hypothetical protein